MRTFAGSTFFRRCGGGESWPLSDSVPVVVIPGSALLALAAGQKDASAVEAQVLVGFTAMPLAVELQPQRAAVTAVLQVMSHSQSLHKWSRATWLIREAAVLGKHFENPFNEKGYNQWFMLYVRFVFGL